MAIKQALAVAALDEAAGRIIKPSLCEIPGGWLALVETEDGKYLARAVQGEEAAAQKWMIDGSDEVNGIQVDIMPLNANNAALVRRLVKWAAPTACGTKGTSVGFSDWLGEAGAQVSDLFLKRQLKPVLVDYTPEDSAALERNFLEAVDTATWGILEKGYKESYGANAAGLKTEEEIVKALLYGYSMIGFDCSDKINMEIEKLSAEAVAKRFEEFNETFRAALNASYLKVEFKVGNSKLSFTEEQLQRIVLEYGEAIMHVQDIYKNYLKNTPWEIDFELSLSKPGKVLTPQEHYLIANEMQRNGIKVTSVCLDPLKDSEALNANLQLHCEIADTFGYRLSFCNAEFMEEPAVAMKALKSKVHFKLNNVLWMEAVKLIAAKDQRLFNKIAEAIGAEAVAVDAFEDMEVYKAFALSYIKVLNPKEANLAGRIKGFLELNHESYSEAVHKAVGEFLKKL